MAFVSSGEGNYESLFQTECLHMGVIGPCACGSGSARICAFYADDRVQIDGFS